MTAPAENTRDAIAIACIAIRAQMRDRNDPDAETVCYNDIEEAVEAAGAMLGMWIDPAEARREVGEQFKVRIRQTATGERFTYL